MLNFRMIVFIIILAPTFLSFSFFKTKPRNHADMAREIRSVVGNKLAKKHKMDVIGVSGGMMGSVYIIGLRFQIHHPMDRNEARERIVDCVEEMLAAVNANEEIRPFLKNFPFTEKNIDIAIFTNYPDGREVFDPDVRVVSVNKLGYVTYRTEEPNGHLYEYKSVYRELYSEALAKLKDRVNGQIKGKEPMVAKRK